MGRSRRFLTAANPWLNGIVGDWAVNLTGRVQAGTQLTATGVRLVGMTEDDLQDMFEFRDTGATLFNLPEDVILNTRRAFNTDPTTPSGYSSLGVPEGRYIAPASSLECVQIFAGDCGQRNYYVRGPAFTRFDLNAKKMFPLGGRKSFVLQIDVLNVFNAANINPVFNPGGGAGIFQVTSAYQDVSGTYDPGGRLMQLVFRVNW